MHNRKERKNFRHDVGDGALDVPARSGHMRKKCSATSHNLRNHVRRLRTICEITEHFLASCFLLPGGANLSPTGGDRVMRVFCNRSNLCKNGNFFGSSHFCLSSCRHFVDSSDCRQTYAAKLGPAWGDCEGGRVCPPSRSIYAKMGTFPEVPIFAFQAVDTLSTA